MALSQRVVDLYLRKSWWATLRLRPDVIIFLGDMMDGGRFAMSDAECACPCPNITASDALNKQVRRLLRQIQQYIRRGQGYPSVLYTW